MSFQFHDGFEGIDEQDLVVYNPLWAITGGNAGSTAKIDTARKLVGNASYRAYVKWLTNQLCGMTVTRLFSPQLKGWAFASFNTQLIGMNRVGIFGTSVNGSGGGGAGYIRMFNLADPAYVQFCSGSTYYSTSLRIYPNIWYSLKMQFDGTTKKYSAWIKGGTFTEWTVICTNAYYYNWNLMTNFNINAVQLVGQISASLTGDRSFNLWWDEVQLGLEAIIKDANLSNTKVIQ